jgi:hypothetical protein
MDLFSEPKTADNIRTVVNVLMDISSVFAGTKGLIIDEYPIWIHNNSEKRSKPAVPI